MKDKEDFMNRRTVWIAVVAMVLVGVVSVGAEEPDLDPLLELLVEQGVITMEQAQAVQAEYDRRRTAVTAPAVVPPATTAVQTKKLFRSPMPVPAARRRRSESAGSTRSRGSRRVPSKWTRAERRSNSTKAPG